MGPATDRYDAPVDVGPRIDLHLHSLCSDGRSRPAEVMAAAAREGLKAVSLTDHDTVSGIDEASRSAHELGLEFVPGIELSTYDESGSTHLLGYCIEPGNPDLLEFLERARESRLGRAREIVERLNRLGIGLGLEDVLTEARPGGLIARPHIARALVAGGWVRHYAEAFTRFIAAGQPAYVPTRHSEPGGGIGLIHRAGGLAFLAHCGKSHTEAAIRGLVDAGLDGLEILHPEHGPVEVRKLRRLTAELDLLESGGSDWHGPRDDRRGLLASQPVPYDWYLRLRAAVATRRSAVAESGRGD